MKLSPMRYKDFIWPHNPRTYAIEYERVIAVNKVPYGRYQLQDLGPTRRILRGEGEFVGEDAYRTFQALASVFYQEGPGLLVHPVWQSSNAYFTQLRLLQEPTPDYVRYSFTFREGYSGYDQALRERSGTETAETVHTVARGETLWALANQYGVELAELRAANPWLKNPNLLQVGDKVVIPG